MKNLKEMTMNDLDMIIGGKADWLNIGMPTPMGKDQNNINNHLPRPEESPLFPPIGNAIEIAIDFFFS